MSDLRGLRCVALVRTSTLGQTENGISQQLDVCRAYAEKEGMIWTDAEKAPGVSGYQTEDRDDLDRILRRKHDGEDFQVVVVHDYSRLTRGGIDHGGYVLWMFTRAGLRVVSATNDIPDNEYAPLLRAIEFLKGQGYSEATARNTARGRMAAIMDGRSTHCGQPPYGVDRLYLSARGEKLFRLRNLCDGRQLKLRPDLGDDTVIGVFEPNVKLEDGSVLMRHYKKQPSERVTLVPGESQAVANVKYILHRHYVEGIGAPTIAFELNERSAVADSGGAWNIASVSGIIRQPVYVGRGICNFIDEAKIFNRCRSQPRKVERGRSRDIRYRPESEWEIVEYTSLRGPDFVPCDLREVIWGRIKDMYRTRAAGTNKRGGDKHVASSFFLKGSIFTSEGHLLRGTQSRPGYRYYITTKHREIPSATTRARKHIFPAKPLEESVKEALLNVISNLDPHLDSVRDYIDRRFHMALRDSASLRSLVQERERVAEELVFSTTELAVLGAELLSKKIAPMKATIVGLDARIDSAKRAAAGVGGTTDQIVETVRKQLLASVSAVQNESSPAFRNLVSSLTRTVVHLEDQSVEIEVRIPLRLLNSKAGAQMCLDSAPLPTRRIETYKEESVVLHRERCSLFRKQRLPCLRCRRQAA